MCDKNVCKKCILNSSFPNIHFDEDGVCNYCKEDEIKNDINKNENSFLDLIKEVKGKYEYDCLLAFSGGKDSTYTLSILKKKYGLNILTYTFDNGFLSDQAKKNIKTVTENIGVDNIILAPRMDLLKGLFKEAAINKNLYSNAALMRASAVCTTCINFIRYSLLKVCVDKNIPMLIFGWAPGQIDKRSIIFKPNKAFLKKSQRVFLDSNKKYLKDYERNYFLVDDKFDDINTVLPYFVNPLLFNEYNYEIVNKEIEAVGWSKPKDTDASSTNCLLNTLGNYIHEERYGFNPYSKEISELIRKGIITREKGLEKLHKKINKAVLDECIEKLGLRIEEL